MDNTSTTILIIFLVMMLMLELYLLGGWRQNNDIHEDVTESNVIETTDSPETIEETTEEPFPEAPRTAPETTEVIAETTVEETVETTSEPETTATVSLYYDVPLDADLQEHIFALCEIYEVNPAVVISMIARESSFRPDVMGDGGESYGLMQIKKKWHIARMERLGVTDLLDPYQNVMVGIDLLAELLRYKDNLEWALMCYNGGYSYADKRIKSGKISDYAEGVISMSNSLVLKPLG